MRFTYSLKKISAPFMALGAILMLSSCGAYQYVGYDNDGIYSSDEVVVDVNQAATNRTNDNYYANYFAEHVNEAQLLQDEGEVFTDIDSYSSGSVASQDVEIIEDYGGWGQVNDQVTINYYNTGWNNWGWGFNDPWLWNGGFGWNNWGWNRGFGFNGLWNRPFWSVGLGWGWNDPWLWNGGFGWGYNNWGWNNGFHRNQFAYNYSRRGNAYNRSSVQNSRRNRTGVSRRLASVNRRGTTVGRRNTTTRPSRTIRDPRIRGGNSTLTRPSRGVTTRPSRGTTTRPSRGTTTRPSRGTTTRPSRGTTTRPSRGSVSRPSRSGSVRSSRSSSSRSSGSVRSSSSRSSSSGGSRSGGSRGGGRRG